MHLMQNNVTNEKLKTEVFKRNYSKVYVRTKMKIHKQENKIIGDTSFPLIHFISNMLFFLGLMLTSTIV